MDVSDKTIDDDRMSMISEASTVVANLEGSKISEVKRYNNPPEGAKDVLIATLILLGRPKSEQCWKGANKVLGSPLLLKEVTELDFEKIPVKTRQETMKYLSKHSAEQIKNISVAVAAFYNWAIAVAMD